MRSPEEIAEEEQARKQVLHALIDMACREFRPIAALARSGTSPFAIARAVPVNEFEALTIGVRAGAGLGLIGLPQ